MKHLLIAVCLFLSFGSNAQQKSADPEDVIFCDLPIEAAPNYREWTNFLNKYLIMENFITDSMRAGCYTVMLQFVIDCDGKLTDVTVLKDPGYGLGEKVRKLVAGYKGRWQPAMIGGTPVKSYRKQPITFIIDEEEEECDELKPGDSI